MIFTFKGSLVKTNTHLLLKFSLNYDTFIMTPNGFSIWEETLPFDFRCNYLLGMKFIFFIKRK